VANFFLNPRSSAFFFSKFSSPWLFSISSKAANFSSVVPFLTFLKWLFNSSSREEVGEIFSLLLLLADWSLLLFSLFLLDSAFSCWRVCCSALSVSSFCLFSCSSFFFRSFSF